MINLGSKRGGITLVSSDRQGESENNERSEDGHALVASAIRHLTTSGDHQ